jgi:putative DNA primase/helicase
MEEWTPELLSGFEHTTDMPLFVEYEAIFSETNQDDDADTKSLKRLAALSNIQYDRVRKDEAKRLGISLATLDKEVEKVRPQNTNAMSDEPSDIFPIIEPWTDPVTATELLQELPHTFKRFAILPEHADTVLSLWVIFTWLIDHVGASPILAISSPEKRCGKTTVISILGNLVCKPILASNISAAALFRTIELWKPTIIIDEADTFIRDSDELRGIINSGHTRPTAYVIRTTGDDHTPKRFSTWGAKAIAIIGTLPDTLNDRSIVIQLRRKLTIEKTEKLRHADPNLFNELQRKLLRFANDHAEIITNSPTYFPESIRISDRALDNWEPLLSIAKLAGNAWVEKVYQAAMSFSENDKEILPIGTELLKDIEKIFSDKSIIKIHTVDLINYLCEDEESPWSMYNFRGQGKKITPRQLSKLLSPYQIITKNIEIGGVQRKGFDKYIFEESWKRYNVSSIPLENAVFAVQPSTSVENSASAVIPHPSNHMSSLPSSILTNASTIAIYSSARPENAGKSAIVDGWTPNTVNMEVH